MKNWKWILFITLFLKVLYYRVLVYEEVSVIGTVSEISLSTVIFLLIINFGASKKAIWVYLYNLVMSITLFGVVVYNGFYGNIVSFYALEQAGQLQTLGDTIKELLRIDYLLFFVDLAIVLPLFFVKKERKQWLPNKKWGLIGVAAFLVTFVGIQIYTGSVDYINEKEIANDKGFVVYQLNVYEKMKSMNENVDGLVGEMKGKFGFSKQSKFQGVARDKNVIIIQLESFENFPIGRSINGEELTPNINKLLNESMYFPDIYQSVGSGNTADAEFIVNTGLYPLGTQAMSNFVNDTSIPSLPKLLRKEGYNSYTFHTNVATYWNRNNMYKALGFDRYYDKSYFGTEDTLSFGSSDEVLYSKVANELESKKEEKYYAHIIAMSSHHPFKIPDDKVKIDLPADYKGSNFGNYLEAANYADYCLGIFIEDLRAKDILENSVIMVYGDHFGLSLKEENEKKWYKELTGFDHSRILDGFNIPLIVRLPNAEEVGVKDNLGAQIDFMPTIASLVGIDLKDYVYFGNSLFGEGSKQIGERFYAPEGTFLTEDILYIPGKIFEEGEAYNRETREKVDVQAYKEDYKEVTERMKLSDRYITNLIEENME